MEYFLVRYASRVVIYERRGFIRLDTGNSLRKKSPNDNNKVAKNANKVFT